MKKILALLVLLTGCASAKTEIDSVYDRSAQPLGSVIVAATGSSIGEQEILETTITQELSSHGIQARRALDHLPLTYTPEEAADMLINAGTEGILVVNWSEKGQISGPLVTMTITPTISAGRVIARPSAGFVIDLYDTRTNKLVWRANAASSGNNKADYKTLAEDVAREIVSKLVEDGILK